MAIGAALIALAVPTAFGQVGAIAIGATIGWRWLPDASSQPQQVVTFTIRHSVAIGSLVAFVVLLVGLPIASATGIHFIQVIDAFYRSGSLVFGGGHVVLPLLQRAVVPPGWLTNDAFLAGYDAAQAVPGPLFTFAAYLGTVMNPHPNGVVGGLICLVAIYLPSFLLLIGILPFWDALRMVTGVRAALHGINAAVVGLLLAALYTPVWTSAIDGPRDFGIGIAAFLALVFWTVPPWLVVVGGALAAMGLAMLST